MEDHESSARGWYWSEFLCVGKFKASTFTRTWISIKISHGRFRNVDAKSMVLGSFGFFTKFYLFFLHENLTFSPKFKIMAERKSTISTCVSDIDVNSCAKASTFTCTRIQIKISHHCFETFDWIVSSFQMLNAILVINAFPFTTAPNSLLFIGCDFWSVVA